MDLYDKGAPTAVSGLEYGVKRRLDALPSKSLEAKAVLDVGCGFAAYSLAAEKYGAKMSVGIDTTQEYIGRSGLAMTVLADAHALPFRDCCFDIVLMVEVLEHLSNPRKALSEVRSVLKSGGLLFITVPNKFYPFETHGMKIGHIKISNLFGIGIPFLSLMPDFLRQKFERARVYTQKDLLHILLSERFVTLKVEYMMPPLDRLKDKNFALVLRRLLRKLEVTALKYFACHIIVVSVTIK